MNSDWIVHRRDGISFIMSESKHKEFKKINGDFCIYEEEYYFVIKDAIEEYRHLEVIE